MYSQSKNHEKPYPVWNLRPKRHFRGKIFVILQNYRHETINNLLIITNQNNNTRMLLFSISI